MSELRWHNYPSPDKVDLLPQGAEVAYTIPYEWGSLRMTESAKQAYGLVPLVPDVLPGASDVTVDKNLPVRTDILVMGPDELPAEQADDDDAMIYVNPVLNRAGLMLSIGTTRSLAGQRDKILTEVRQQFGSTEGLFADDGVPIDEALGQQLPFLFAHMFTQSIEQAVRAQTMDYARAKAARNMYSVLRWTGAYGLLVSGLVDIPEIIESHAVGPFGIGITAGLLATQGGRAAITLRRYLKTTNDRERDIQGLGFVYSELVGSSVHRTFCGLHFNAQAEQLLPED